MNVHNEKMEQCNIKIINIEFDEITKSFRTNVVKDNTNVYYLNYKIIRRKKKQKENNNINNNIDYSP